MQIQVCLTVKVDPAEESAESVCSSIRGNLEHAIGHGLLTGDSMAAVDEWKLGVSESVFTEPEDPAPLTGGVLSMDDTRKIYSLLASHPDGAKASAAAKRIRIVTNADGDQGLVKLAQGLADDIAKDGELEFDDNPMVSLGVDNGAYVQGWSWVDFPDGTICAEDSEEEEVSKDSSPT